MKVLVVFLCSLFLLSITVGVSGCKTEVFLDWELPENIATLESIDEVLTYMSTLPYKEDTIRGDWQTPEETYARGMGDCEDKVVLFSYIVSQLFGGQAVMDCLENTETGTYHAIARFNNEYYEVSHSGFKVRKLPDHYKVVRTYTLSEMLLISGVFL